MGTVEEAGLEAILAMGVMVAFQKFYLPPTIVKPHNQQQEAGEGEEEVLGRLDLEAVLEY
jgi:hypothetical protein